MSQDPEKLVVGLHEGLAVEAGCRGRDCRAGADWRGEHDSWLREAEERGSAQKHQEQEEGAQDPGGLGRTWQPSCDGGSHGPGGLAGTGRCAYIPARYCTCKGNLAGTVRCAELDPCSYRA